MNRWENGQMFYVSFRSVDGYGSYPDTFKTVSEAITFADGKQEYSNSRGNPYGYVYFVNDLRILRGPIYDTLKLAA